MRQRWFGLRDLLRMSAVRVALWATTVVSCAAAVVLWLTADVHSRSAGAGAQRDPVTGVRFVEMVQVPMLPIVVTGLAIALVAALVLTRRKY